MSTTMPDSPDAVARRTAHMTENLAARRKEHMATPVMDAIGSLHTVIASVRDAMAVAKSDADMAAVLTLFNTRVAAVSAAGVGGYQASMTALSGGVADQAVRAGWPTDTAYAKAKAAAGGGS